jgi:hypothetical protein
LLLWLWHLSGSHEYGGVDSIGSANNGVIRHAVAVSIDVNTGSVVNQR